MMVHDFLMEKRLYHLNRPLHHRFTDAVFALQHTLSHYKRLFPEYTDHTEQHSMQVIDFCNRLIGSEQIEKLNADEIYVLLMSCYLHDVGMGVSKSDYEAFKQELGADALLAEHPRDTEGDIVRRYHHEFSGCFIRKYAQMLEIPTQEHLFCIVQVSRGHRKTDLFDAQQYPAAYPVPSGNTVCLPYLAALIRLADEIDVAADRNSQLLYDIGQIQDTYQIYMNKLQKAVTKLHVDTEGFVMEVCTQDAEIYQGLCEVRLKMQETLDLCRNVVKDRTRYCITQKQVEMRRSIDNGEHINGIRRD